MQTISATDGNVTQETFLQLIDEYLDVDAAVDQALAMRKDLRKRIKGAGISLAAFDRTRKEADKSFELREEEDRQFRRNMAWLGKPLGAQGDMFEDTEANGHDSGDAVSEHQSYQVELSGRAAGEAGHERSSNPWGVGSLLNQTWDKGWLTGQEILAQRLVPQDGAPRRGRPRKSAAAE